MGGSVRGKIDIIYTAIFDMMSIFLHRYHYFPVACGLVIIFSHLTQAER